MFFTLSSAKHITYLTSLWLPSICHKLFGAATAYLRLWIGLAHLRAVFTGSTVDTHSCKRGSGTWMPRARSVPRTIDCPASGMIHFTNTTCSCRSASDIWVNCWPTSPTVSFCWVQTYQLSESMWTLVHGETQSDVCEQWILDFLVSHSLLAPHVLHSGCIPTSMSSQRVPICAKSVDIRSTSVAMLWRAVSPWIVIVWLIADSTEMKLSSLRMVASAISWVVAASLPAVRWRNDAMLPKN